MDKQIRILHGDCLELLPKFPSESVDLIVTDPAYQSLRKWEGIGTTGRMGLGKKGTAAANPDKFYDTITNEQLKQVLSQLYRILKPNCHCYIMCNEDTLPFMYSISKINFSNIKLLIWDKCKMGMGYHYRNSYECICMLDKGKNRRLNDLGMSDILRSKKDGKLVPTQKPVELFKTLILQSSKEQEIVLDPFLGSATIAVAALQTNRRCIGIEKKQEYIDKIRIRLEEINAAKI